MFRGLFPINGNYVVPTLHSAIGGLTALTSLSLSFANNTWVSEIGRLTNLRTLTISEPSYTSNGSEIPFPTSPFTLPTQIGFFASLTTLQVTSRSLKVLPSEIGRLSSLTQLIVSCPNLTTVPSELGLPAQLNSLRLNVAGGVLPSTWDNKRFFYIDITNSNLTGKLPLIVYDGPADSCSMRGNKFDTTVSLCPHGCSCDRTVVLQPQLTLPIPPTPVPPTTTTTTTDDNGDDNDDARVCRARRAFDRTGIAHDDVRHCAWRASSCHGGRIHRTLCGDRQTSLAPLGRHWRTVASATNSCRPATSACSSTVFNTTATTTRTWPL
jgi:hypothetical protein